jgi:hypothetical protein
MQQDRQLPILGPVIEQVSDDFSEDCLDLGNAGLDRQHHPVATNESGRQGRVVDRLFQSPPERCSYLLFRLALSILDGNDRMRDTDGQDILAHRQLHGSPSFQVIHNAIFYGTEATLGFEPMLSSAILTFCEET